MSIQTIITKLAELEAALPGIKAAYDVTPSGLTVFPCFINYPRDGELHWAASDYARSDHYIVCECRVTRQNLPQDEALLRPYIAEFRDMIAEHLTLEGVCEQVYPPIYYEYGALAWGTNELHLGIRFTIRVIEKEDVTPGL